MLKLEYVQKYSARSMTIRAQHLNTTSAHNSPLCLKIKIDRLHHFRLAWLMRWYIVTVVLSTECTNKGWHSFRPSKLLQCRPQSMMYE